MKDLVVAGMKNENPRIFSQDLKGQKKEEENDDVDPFISNSRVYTIIDCMQPSCPGGHCWNVEGGKPGG
jgi:hypothetical protein